LNFDLLLAGFSCCAVEFAVSLVAAVVVPGSRLQARFLDIAGAAGSRPSATAAVLLLSCCGTVVCWVAMHVCCCKDGQMHYPGAFQTVLGLVGDVNVL
jgi:hypothetical protein